MAVAEQIAELVCAVPAKHLPDDAVHWAKVSILDTLGVALAGTREDCARISAHVIKGGEGGCLLLGTNRHIAPLDAALLNGTAAHAQDFDASNNTLAGHPSVHLLPALYALAEERGSSGAAFVAAYIAGFETQCRMARGLQPLQAEKGWFPSSALGVFGTAAGSAHLMGLDVNQTAQALGLAAMLASGTLVNAGTMTKPLGAGHGARSGLMAAMLVADGFSASVDALDAKRGYFNLFNGMGHYETAPMLADWGKPYEVNETAVGLKQHPCCGVLQSTVDVMAELTAEHKLTPANVERVEVLLISKRLGHVDRPHPRSGTDAKFSVQFCVARTLENGRLGIDDFEGVSYGEPATQGLMTRVTAAEHPSMGVTASRDEQGGAELHVLTTDGRHLTGRASQPFGRVPGEPLPTRLLHGKFLDCARRALTPGSAEAVLGLLTRLESVGSVRELSAAMVPVNHAA